MDSISLTERQFLDGLLSELDGLGYDSLTANGFRLAISLQTAVRVMLATSEGQVTLDGFTPSQADMSRLVRFATVQAYLLFDGEHYRIQSRRLRPRVGTDDLWFRTAKVFIDVYKSLHSPRRTALPDRTPHYRPSDN